MPRCCLHWGWLCLERAWRWVLSHSGVPGSRVLQAVWLSEGPAPHLPVLHCIPWLEFSTRVTVCRLYTKLLAQDKSQKGECSEVLVGRGWFAECESRVPAHPGATSPVASVSGPVGLGPYPAPPHLPPFRHQPASCLRWGGQPELHCQKSKSCLFTEYSKQLSAKCLTDILCSWIIKYLQTDKN